jgi:hypothetical protein
MAVRFEEGHVVQIIANAVIAERERCAKVCERLAKDHPYDASTAAIYLDAAEEIRKGV